MKHKTRQQEAILSIDQLNKSGNGIATWERENAPPSEVEVPFTAPGDIVKVITLGKKNRQLRARLEEVITPAPNRIQPKCPHFGVCGGCRWQHIPYEDQLAHKEQQVRTYFQSMLDTTVHIHPIVACSPPWAYRNKMEFSFSMDAAQHRYLGLIMDSSRGKVFNLRDCFLTNPWFMPALQSVREWWHETGLLAYHPYSNRGSLRTLTLREGMRTGDRMAMLTVSGNPDYALTQQQIDLYVAFLRCATEQLDIDKHLSIFVRIQQIAKGKPTEYFEIHLNGPDTIRERLHIQPHADKPVEELEFTISPSAFFQPNTQQAEKLYSLALQRAEVGSDSVVYDLYCGTGTLGICAARTAKEVVGIELSPESSLDARTNAKNNHIENITIHTGDVGQVLAKIRAEGLHPLPDIVLVDPPRAGLDAKAIEHICALGAKKIVYISCNPVTQAQNCIELISRGYRLRTIQPVDQFPHTVHIENIAVLERSSQ